MVLMDCDRILMMFVIEFIVLMIESGLVILLE